MAQCGRVEAQRLGMWKNRIVPVAERTVIASRTNIDNGRKVSGHFASWPEEFRPHKRCTKRTTTWTACEFIRRVKKLSPDYVSVRLTNRNLAIGPINVIAWWLSCGLSRRVAQRQAALRVLSHGPSQAVNNRMEIISQPEWISAISWW